jgi:cysteine-rich repeat protein
MRAVVALVALLALVAAPASGHARGLLRPAPGAADLLGEPGIRTRQLLALEPGALADLRSRTEARIEGLPLGTHRQVAVTLTRTDPLRGARLQEVANGRVHALARPDTTYFIGTVDGDPTSRVLVAAGPSRVRGFVMTEGTAYLFGPDARGALRSYDLRDVDESVYPAREAFCDNDLHAALVQRPLALRPPPSPSLPRAAFTGQILQVDVAIETDVELRNAFPSSAAALDYVAALVAAANTIYERDLGLRLNASYVRLWTGTDPWTANATNAQLDQLQGYWTNPANDMLAIAGPRATVHFLSGRPATGGIAYLSAICDYSYGFGVSQVDGDFNLALPSQIWDVVVFTHEIGHNVGSQHSHCFNPPLDRCYNQEPGCYSGSVVASRGSVMSYCHTLAGGLSNIDLLFPPTIVDVVRQVTAQASCLEPVGETTCGDGTLDAGEECDDGNAIFGDGCSPSCRLEVCGNGVIEPGEQCDDGNATSGDGCSATCRDEVCGNGVVDVGEQCDDGNTTPQDGCTGKCTIERCPILVSHQENWASAQVALEPRMPGNERLTIKGTFGVPAGATVDVASGGVRFLFEDASGAPSLDTTLPGGTAWKVRGARAIYRDDTGTVAGIRKVTVRTRQAGSITDVKIAVAAVGGPYPTTVETMPQVVTVLLGDASAVDAGACGIQTFGAASCRDRHNGRRFLCK